MTKTVYIAGPMRGFPKFNFDAFDTAEAKLKAMGYNVLSPASMDRAIGFDPEKNSLEDFDFTDCVRRDIEAIIKADWVVTLPMWDTSTGAKAEVAVARWLKKRVFALSEILP